MENENKKVLLALVDSPTVNTGFAGVGRNLLSRWLPHFDRIDVWGIGYDGNPHEFPYFIYRAGGNWTDPANLKRFLERLMSGDYTHLFLLQDTFLLSDKGLPGFLRQICARNDIRLITYFPVDAPMEPDWLDIVKVSHAAATYTEYGRREALRALGDPPCAPEICVIPHGVDANVFRPLPNREALRACIFHEWKDKLILVNVNRNERRKALAQSLFVLKRLIEIDIPARLYLHTHTFNKHENFDLKLAGNQLGLTYGEEWLTADEQFSQGVGTLPESRLNEIYNAADLCITTSLGEGWGLSVTEAAAAGLNVIAPDHTSLPEIARIVGGRITLCPVTVFPVTNAGDNSRVRYAVDVRQMAALISSMCQVSGVRCQVSGSNREGLPPSAVEELSWDRIAGEFLKMMEVGDEMLTR